jgi:hypothetical protein
LLIGIHSGNIIFTRLFLFSKFAEFRIDKALETVFNLAFKLVQTFFSCEVFFVIFSKIFSLSFSKISIFDS